MYRDNLGNEPEKINGARRAGRKKGACTRSVHAWTKKLSDLDYSVASWVEALFEHAPDRHDKETRTNPVTGGRWVQRLDPINKQKQQAYVRLVARKQFAETYQELPLLPLSYNAREHMKRGGGVTYVLALFARSLDAVGYDLRAHPDFHTYACGVTASPLAPWFIIEDEELKRRFPPAALPGLGSGLYWDPPKKQKGSGR